MSDSSPQESIEFAAIKGQYRSIYGNVEVYLPEAGSPQKVIRRVDNKMLDDSLVLFEEKLERCKKSSLVYKEINESGVPVVGFDYLITKDNGEDKILCFSDVVVGKGWESAYGEASSDEEKNRIVFNVDETFSKLLALFITKAKNHDAFAWDIRLDQFLYEKDASRLVLVDVDPHVKDLTDEEIGDTAGIAMQDIISCITKYGRENFPKMLESAKKMSVELGKDLPGILSVQTAPQEL